MLRTENTLSTTLYWVNASLLAAHEVDSGYWKEWDLFMLPGGAGGFVLLHVALFLIVLWGYEQTLRGTRAGRGMGYGLAGAGLFAIVAHTAFLLLGRPEFRSAVSVALLATIGIVSILQVIVLARAR